MRHRFALATLTIALFLALPGGDAAASATVRLVIAHVVSHCHVWKTATKTLGASTRLVVRPRTRLVIRSDCPMDFDFTQTKGPRLPLGDARTFAGTTRVIGFVRPGVYRLKVTNVETPEDRGLVTLGETNTLTLAVVVKP